MRVTLGNYECSNGTLDRVSRVLRSGRLSYGPESRELEREFAVLHDSKYGVLSNSGTSSLVVALQALKELNGWPDWSEVICPAITFVATVNAVLHCRMTPVLCDVHPLYYDINPYQIAHHITDKTVAVIAVNVFGKPADLPSIAHICSTNGLMLIEDSCEAVLVDIAGKRVGSWGKVGVFSFYMAHILTAGVGGIAITDDYDLAQKMRSLVNHGLSVRNLPRPGEYDPSFLERSFEFDSIGHSFRITELEAAVAIEELGNLTSNVQQRQKIAEKYHDIFDGLRPHMQLPLVRPNSRSSWMMYPIALEYRSKHGIMNWLRQNDIEVRDMLPLTNQPCYGDIFREDDYPVAKRINKHGFYIGCHPGIDGEQLNYVGEKFFEFWGKDENK